MGFWFVLGLFEMISLGFVGLQRVFAGFYWALLEQYELQLVCITAGFSKLHYV